MWIILLFACVSVILPNNAQELTSFESQTATEAYVNGGVNIDTTVPPVRVTIRNGKTDNINQANAQNPDLSTFYSNQWKPVLIPIGFNSNRHSQIYVNENKPSIEHQSVPTLLKRPDLEGNYTVPHHYSLIEERNEFSGSNVHYHPFPYLQSNTNLTTDSSTNIADQIYPEILPNDSIPRNGETFQPFDLYRNTQSFIHPVISVRSTSQSSFDSNAEKININSTPEEFSLTPVQESTDSLTTKINEEFPNPPSIDRRYTGEEEVSKPEIFYRNSQRYFPPMVPAYFLPNTYLPFQRNGVFRPIVPYPSNGPGFDREAGSEVEERIQEVPLKQDLPGDIERNVPSGTSTNISPPQPIPLPVASGYPFGLYPSPFIPPFIPNIPPTGFPLTPLPLSHARTVQRENIISTLRPSPFVPLPAAPELGSEVLAQTDNLAPEEQTSVISSSEVSPEETVFVDEQNRTKIPYEFGFNMNDGKGNDQHRNEASDIAGVVTGSYGFNIRGIYREVKYIADENGFRAYIVSNEPGVASSGSAGVVVMAERPPIIALANKETEAEIVAVPVSNAEAIEPVTIPESK